MGNDFVSSSGDQSCNEGGVWRNSWTVIAKAAGTKVLRESSEPRSDIGTGPDRKFRQCFQTPRCKRLLGAFFDFQNCRREQHKMSRALGKVLYLRNDTILKQAFSLLRISGDNPICSAGGILLSTSRQYRSKPTHGIGRYKHLIKEQEPKKKRGKVEVRPINLGTDYEYGVLNVHLTAYDMALAESYAQYVHNLCNRLSIKVEESYAMPTKTMEVLRLPDQGNKMFLDSVLTTHERVIQISGLSATFAEIFLEIIQNNLPEGVRLSVKEHTEEDFKGRFKARPELEELLAKLN
ncbi:39S ribosomal protein L48, mitochondrial [Talpa occidentalis]|uniref:39S ribosomal protein L48, mitochondrial n=1 Tax=Talpa occidentalis TaxID=50954 RepID=UPI0018904727|nr:39S ribosomal protein L48, mitochondrial [Talpa occidentalis]